MTRRDHAGRYQSAPKPGDYWRDMDELASFRAAIVPIVERGIEALNMHGGYKVRTQCK